MKIDSNDRSIKQVFQAGYYRVPRFQRPYSWTRANVEDFWTDTIVESDADYFIGSIIVFPSKEDTYDIVDGQQRLTTITIMLAALRNTYSRQGLSHLADGLHAYVERRDVNNELQFVLQTESSYPYLHEYIQKFGEPEAKNLKLGAEEEALRGAFDYFARQMDSVVRAVLEDSALAESKKAQRLTERLEQIRDRILGLKLILVEVDNEDDAYIIFETLNTRGKNLTIADLLKNFLLRDLKSKNVKVDVPRDKWNSILELFEASSAQISPDSFIHHSWLSRYDYVSEKKLFKAIRKQVKKGERQAFLDTLVNEARLYRTLHEPQFGKWAKEELPLKQSLQALVDFRVQQPSPFVLSALRAYRTKDIKLAAAKRALWAVECFHFAFTSVASKSSSGGISQMYALHARGVLNASTPDAKSAEIAALESKLRLRMPTLEEFVAAFVLIGYSTVKTQQKRLVQYVLSRYYAHHSSGVALDFSNMTIEHLAPEHASSAQLPNSEIARIGNLILVDEALNNQLANKPFKEKQEILRAHREVWVDPFVLTVEQWTSDEINARSAAMAKIALEKIWTF